MIDPQAYSINLPNYSDTAFRGFNQGLATVMDIGKTQAAFEAQKAAQAQQQQMQADLSDLANNPTPEKFVKYSAMYPQFSESIKRTSDTWSENQKRNSTSTAIQTAMLLKGGDAKGAEDFLENTAKAYENAGSIEQAKSTRALVNVIKNAPEEAYKTALLYAGNGLSGDELSKFLGELGSENRAEQKLQPEINKINAEVGKIGADIGETRARTGLIGQQTETERQNTAIRQAEANEAPDYYSLRNEQTGAQIDKIRSDQRLGWAQQQLNEDKLDADLEWRYEELDRKGRQLDGAGQKMVNDAVLESTTLATMAQQQKDLAARARNSGQMGGWATSGWEGFKNAAGISTSRSDMVKEVTRMINSEVVKGLPPGPATDRDVDMIRKGFPSDKADGETIARFMDAMSRVNIAAAANKQMQAEWQSQNGNLGSSKGDLDVLGIKVPRGMTYQKFASANMGKAINQLDKMNSQQSISRGTASYLKYGQ